MMQPWQIMRKTRIHLLAILLFFNLGTAYALAQNLLRNGSFEGGLLYWHNVKTNAHQVVKGEGRVGEYALRLSSGYVMSSPCAMQRGKRYTISLWARGEKPGKVSVALPPSAREPGQKSGRLWASGAGKSADIGTDWTRVSFTFPADVPQNGFWRLPHYLVQISGGKGNAVYVDGVTVTEGDGGTPDYVPRRPIEIVADCENLPGYRGAAGNTFDVGATARMTAHASNPGNTAREVTVRWQLFDHEGIGAVGQAVEEAATLRGGRTFSKTVPLKLDHKGCVIARLSVLDGTGAELDRSEFPLTSLPYPKKATKPDPRERFGGSFAGGPECLERMQRIGFGWSRWWPKNKWHNFEPEEGKYNWQDELFEEAFERGISCHVVLYGWPKWIMDKEHPLPRDMRWKADDPRWGDFSVITAWDRFVTAAANHFRGKPVILQLANEPGHDKWKNGYIDEYVKFMMRTARLIKKTDPQAKVSLNNVYTHASRVNHALLKAKGLKDIDVWSWHDYHAGRLLDAKRLKRMRGMLDNAGGEHLEIWFTEGWAFTNTRVDEPIACTTLDSVRSTHLIMNCMAEIAACGHEKTVMFHLMYGTHGMSFWDYSGPGTMLWDWYSYPTPLVAAWNVLNHHIGISEEVGFVRPLLGNVCVFDDLRNGRGVVVAFADDDAVEDARLELPDVGSPWIVEDIMGNRQEVPGSCVLSKTGKALILHTQAGTDGKTLLKAFEPQDRKHVGFVSTREGAATYRLPAAWAGAKKGTAEGNPILSDGKPVWRLDRVYPDDPLMSANYEPLPWDGTRWIPASHQHGGNPKAKIESGNLSLGAMGKWKNLEYQKIAGIVFIAPESGMYRVKGRASGKPWTGGAKTYTLSVRKKDTQRAPEIRQITVPRDNTPVPFDFTLELSQEHELVIIPLMPHWHNGCNFRIEGLTVTKVRE